MLLFIILYIAVIVLMIMSAWKINTKAGQPGWACFIPIYSTLISLKIARVPWWWILLMCIPFVGVVWGIWTLNRIVKGFGKSEGFTIGCLFLGIIFLPILGFGSSTYDPDRLDPIE